MWAQTFDIECQNSLDIERNEIVFFHDLNVY